MVYKWVLFQFFGFVTFFFFIFLFKYQLYTFWSSAVAIQSGYGSIEDSSAEDSPAYDSPPNFEDEGFACDPPRDEKK